jgi:hypothetical protein
MTPWGYLRVGIGERRARAGGRISVRPARTNNAPLISVGARLSVQRQHGDPHIDPM